jgi:hypothetical protein
MEERLSWLKVASSSMERLSLFHCSRARSCRSGILCCSAGGGLFGVFGVPGLFGVFALMEMFGVSRCWSVVETGTDASDGKGRAACCADASGAGHCQPMVACQLFAGNQQLGLLSGGNEMRGQPRLLFIGDAAGDGKDSSLDRSCASAAVVLRLPPFSPVSTTMRASHRPATRLVADRESYGLRLWI